MEKVLTISVAAYNIEKYIRKTLDSFVIPDVLNDIEVIVTNDGSKDNTSAVAHEYSDKYPDVFLTVDKENEGYGSTINYACQIARGKYFKTVDGDDWANRDGLTELVKYLKETDDDIVVTNFIRVNDKTKAEQAITFISDKEKSSFFFEQEYNGQKLFMQALTFKTEILRKAKLRLEPCYYVDIEYILTPMPFVSTISFLNQFVYMYRIAVDEQSMSMAGKRKHIDEQLNVLMKMILFYKKHSPELGPGKKKYFVTILSEMYKSHITAILSLDISKAALKRLRLIENFTKSEAPDIYYETQKYKTVVLLRKSGMLLYPIGSISYKLYQRFLIAIRR